MRNFYILTSTLLTESTCPPRCNRWLPLCSPRLSSNTLCFIPNIFLPIAYPQPYGSNLFMWPSSSANTMENRNYYREWWSILRPVWISPTSLHEKYRNEPSSRLTGLWRSSLKVIIIIVGWVGIVVGNTYPHRICRIVRNHHSINISSGNVYCCFRHFYVVYCYQLFVMFTDILH